MEQFIADLLDVSELLEQLTSLLRHPPSLTTLKQLNARLTAHQWLAQEHAFETMPQRVSFTTTTRCNLRCPHCLTHGTEELSRMYNGKVWPERLADRLAQESLPLARDFCLTLNGEPLMTPKWKAKLTKWSKYGAKLDITTNGTLLSETAIETLVPLLSGIHISVDAGTPRVYEAIRAGARFSGLLYNLKLLTRTLEIMDEDPKPYVKLTFTLMGSNIKELPFVIKLADFANIGHVGCTPFVVHHAHVRNEPLSCHKALYNLYRAKALREADPLGIEFEGLTPPFIDDERLDIPETAPNDMIVGILSDEYYSKLRPLDKQVDLQEIDRRAKRIAYRIRGKVSIARDGGEKFDPDQQKELMPTLASWHCMGSEYKNPVRELLLGEHKVCGYCHFLDKWTFVSESGQVTPCCVTVSPVLGNIHEGTLRSIWNGEAYRELRKRIWSLDPPEFCSGCRHLQRLSRLELGKLLVLEAI
jgi:radical SAM protein with 4Fe4S-binding SPASM domain